MLTACVVAICGIVVLNFSSIKTKIAQDQSPLKQVLIESSAIAWVSTLSAEQVKVAVIEYDTPLRPDWNFVPMDTRKGLALKDMTAEQQSAAKDLLQAIVSEYGYSKAASIMSLETLLRELEGPGSEQKRNPLKYYFTLFGQPEENQIWGLSIEGHHLSLNFVLRDGVILDSTPQFMGSSPAKVLVDHGPDYPVGMTVLEAEEQGGFDLLAKLNDEQKAIAIIAEDSPAEIHWNNKPAAEFAKPQGIAVSQMQPAQSALLRKLIKTYADSMIDAVAKHRWQQIDKAGFENVHFAWAGSTNPGDGHYYIVQGPTFLIEFVNNQPDAEGNPANHAHCIWHDADGDFYITPSKVQ